MRTTPIQRMWVWLTLAGALLVLLTACTALTEPVGFIPVGEEPDSAVLNPVIGVTYTPVGEGWLKCAYRYDGVSVCWMVVDTVTVR